MAEQKPAKRRVRNLVSRVTRPLTGASEAITGKGIEQGIAEYSETFTQVALGLHEDLTAAPRRIGELETQVERLIGESSQRSGEHNRLAGPYALGVAALATAVVALGVAVWAPF